MNAMEKAKDAGFTLDPNATAKEYGYKNFKSFAKEYLVAHDIDPKDISVEEVKEFLLGTDRTIEIVQSQENLDKLHSLIVNDKYFRKRTSYFKKKHEKRTKLLVVYINYEKEMAKISKDPNLEKIGRFGFRFRYWKNDGYYSIDGLKEGAFKDCEKEIKKKYKLSGGECILVEYRVGDRYKNLLKPRKIKKLEENKIIAKLSNSKSEKILNKNIKYKTDEKYYALVIGNNNYEHLEKLDAAENDAKVIADVLTNKYGFEVDLLLNADYDTTVNSLFKITNKLKRNDNLLIYYAGHGELDKAENRGYWLPVDASYELRSKWISNQRIVDRIKATKAKHVLLIADSCFSGSLMRGSLNSKNQAINQKYIKRLKNKKTRLVITSGGNEPVVDSDGGNHSLFALKLIDTLKNNNTVINSQILFENIRRYVVSNADQTPERALVHKTGHDGGDFLFFPKQ